MTQYILDSGNTSRLLRTLQDSNPAELEYSLEPSFPILAQNIYEIPSGFTAANIGGQEVQFRLNKSGLWNGAMLKIKISTTAGKQPTRGRTMGYNIIDKIDIRTNGKTLQTMSGAALKFKAEGADPALKQTLLALASPSDELYKYDAVIDNGTFLFVNIPASFFEKPEFNLDLNFWEQINVVVKFKPSLALCAIGNDDITNVGIMEMSLFVMTQHPNEKYLQYLRSKNMVLGQNLNMLCYNSYMENPGRYPEGDQTSLTVKLNSSYPVFKTYIAIRPIKNLSQVYDEKQTITHVTFSVGGSKVLERIPVPVLRYVEALKGNGGTSVFSPEVETTSNFIDNPDPNLAVKGQGIVKDLDMNYGNSVCLNWGLLGGTEQWTRNGGCISFSSLNYPEISIEHSSLDGTNYQVEVVHFYWNVISGNPSNGMLSIEAGV